MDTGREVEEMGAIAIPVLPIREEINLELKEDQREDNNLFSKSNNSLEDEYVSPCFNHSNVNQTNLTEQIYTTRWQCPQLYTF